MQMDEGMDTGPTLSEMRTPIGPDETAGELAERLAQLGAALLRRDLSRAVAGALVAVPQDSSLATDAPLLEKSDGRLDLRWPAAKVHDRVRGMSPWPGATLDVDGKTVKIHRTACADEPTDAPPGQLIDAPKGVLRVACGDGRAVDLLELQDPGKKRLTASQYRAGHGLEAGRQLVSY